MSTFKIIDTRVKERETRVNVIIPGDFYTTPVTFLDT